MDAFIRLSDGDQLRVNNVVGHAKVHAAFTNPLVRTMVFKSLELETLLVRKSAIVAIHLAEDDPE